MKPERAREIILAAKDASTGGYGPWVDWIRAQLQPGELEDIILHWDALPDSTSFLDALESIARGESV